MNQFSINEVRADEKLLSLIERQANIKPTTIHSVIGFDEGSVYKDNTLRLKGILVITGPELRVHVLTQLAATLKYRGFLDYLSALGGVFMSAELSEYLTQYYAKMVPDFQELVTAIATAITDQPKVQ